MAKKYENQLIVTEQEYDRAMSAILGDKDPENCTSAVEVYAMFDKIAKCITESNYYNEMSVVDSTRLDDSIACISNALKHMIGDETLNHAIASHLGMLDDESGDESGDDGEDSAEEDESSEESKEAPIEVDSIENDDSLDVEPIDLIDVWHSCHTNDFTDFEGYASLIFIGRKHGFDHAYIVEQLLYIMHNYNIGCNKIHYVGAAIAVDGVRKTLEHDPKAGDLVYFAYCKRPTFVMYSGKFDNRQRFIIYQCDKDTGTILGVYNKSDLDSVCDALCDVEVDNTAFSCGFDDLKKFCNEHDIDFNLIYRKVVECYVQETNSGIDRVSNINFDITNKFYTKTGCTRYAEEHGSDGDLFMITTQPNNKSKKKNGQMILALVCGSYSDGTKKIFQVAAIEIANHDETYVSSQPTEPKDEFDDGADDNDDIDVSSMKYMTNDDIKKQMDADHAEFIKKMKQSQRRRNVTKSRARSKSSDDVKSTNTDNGFDDMIQRLDATK